MRRIIASALVALALASPASADTIRDRIAALHESLADAPCGTDSDCEARAMAHGVDPAWLDAMADCEDGDDDACAFIDDASDE